MKYSRRSTALATAVLAAACGVFAAAPAQAVPDGVCSNFAAFSGAPGNVATQTCIGHSGTTVWGWLYWKNTGYSCWGTLKIRDDTLGTFQAFDVNGCSPTVVDFTGISGHHYHVYSNTDALLYGEESNPAVQYSGTAPNSPELIL